LLVGSFKKGQQIPSWRVNQKAQPHFLGQERIFACQRALHGQQVHQSMKNKYVSAALQSYYNFTHSPRHHLASRTSRQPAQTQRRCSLPHTMHSPKNFLADPTTELTSSVTALRSKGQAQSSKGEAKSSECVPAPDSCEHPKKLLLSWYCCLSVRATTRIVTPEKLVRPLDR
jgi:hypothetical protein